MVFNDLVAGALRLLRVLAAGETPSADEAEDCRLACNLMLDSWSTEKQNIYQVGSASYPLTSTKAQYLIGTGASDFNAPRPVKIEYANITLPNPGGAGALRFPLKLLSFREWQAVIEAGAAGTTPRGLYYDRAFPFGALNLTPVPTWSGTVRSLELFAWSVLAQFPDLVTDVPLAPGYGRALQHCLALELAPQFDATVTEVLAANAAEAKAAIRALNEAMPDEEPEAQPLNNTPAQARPQQGQ